MDSIQATPACKDKNTFFAPSRHVVDLTLTSVELSFNTLPHPKVC